MSDAQIFQLIGLAYFACGLGWVFQPKWFVKLLDDYANSAGLVCLGGYMALVIGFLLVTFHNQWNGGWTVVITVFGWLALVKGVLLLLVPGLFQMLSNRFKRNAAWLRAYAVLVAVIGAGLLVLGFAGV